VIVTEVASVEVHVSVTDWPATMDCDDTLSETVGTGVAVVAVVAVVTEEALLLPPLPHALKKSATPAHAATSNIEDFRRTNFCRTNFCRTNFCRTNFCRTNFCRTMGTAS
jgi:hypothetical protein